MAIKAETHREWLGPIGQRHLIDSAVAGLAADALGDVDVVAKIHVVRQLRHARPCDRLVFGKALPDRLQHRRVVQIWEWQVMQVAVGGKPACGAVSTPLWQ